jgi:hypothetical protein
VTPEESAIPKAYAFVPAWKYSFTFNDANLAGVYFILTDGDVAEMTQGRFAVRRATGLLEQGVVMPNVAHWEKRQILVKVEVPSPVTAVPSIPVS